MRKISSEEIHERLLTIADAFDKTCTKNGIPYFMLGGTMLGAIRHKGFIPWDDDMDFGVPRSYYAQMISCMEKDLPSRFKCCTYKTAEGCITPFVKISDTETLLDDPRTMLGIERQIGLNIDVFPLDFCERESKVLKRIHLLGIINRWVYIGNSEGNVLKNSLKKIVKSIFPISQKRILETEEKLASKLSDGDYLANVYGRWREKEIIPVSWYGTESRYQFENLNLCGIKESDKYLTQLYGKYMELPPKEKRVMHCSNIYVKDT